MEGDWRGTTYWEGIGGIRDEETRLTDGTVTDDHTLDGLHVANVIEVGFFWNATIALREEPKELGFDESDGKLDVRIAGVRVKNAPCKDESICRWRDMTRLRCYERHVNTSGPFKLFENMPAVKRCELDRRSAWEMRDEICDAERSPSRQCDRLNNDDADPETEREETTVIERRVGRCESAAWRKTAVQERDQTRFEDVEDDAYTKTRMKEDGGWRMEMMKTAKGISESDRLLAVGSAGGRRVCDG